MENNQRNSRKRLNSLILLVAFTAVMLIVSTYAWFSTQKNVTISGLKGVVNVAEGLQISLDAKHWVNSIDFDHFDQTSVDSWTVSAGSPTTYLDSDKTFQKPVGDAATNVVPEELLPVSTTAYKATSDGIGQTAVKFYRGTNTETVKLMNDTNVLTENSDAGYFAFDLYIMNTSAGDAQDVIQLDPVSDVTGSNESAGVQNTARIALALYENNNDAVGFDPDNAEAGDDMTIAGTNALTQADIVAGTSTGKKIKDVAIWEPNANAHTDTIVASPSNSLKLIEADKGTLVNVNKTVDGSPVYVMSRFDNDDLLPTYALTSASIASPVGDGKTVHIADVYDWDATPATGVKRQFTLQTDAYIDANQRNTSVDFVSTMKSEANATTPSTYADTKFTISPNQYQKIRVYFWMEGQDPDCINAASLGGGLELDLGFSKPGQEVADPEPDPEP